MNIFVSGATGFIGNRLTWELIRQGHVVHALCRFPHKSDDLDHPDIRIFQGSITDPEKVQAAMDGCRQAFHLAGYAKPWAKDPAIYKHINLEGTRYVLEAARKAGVEKVVFTSSAGVMGPSYERPVWEGDPPPDTFFNLYESTKFQAEQLVKAYADAGMEAVIVNPSRVYGPGRLSESNAVTKLIKWYIEGLWRILPDNGSRFGNYAFIDDVVKGHLLAMEKGRSGKRYLLGGENVSYNAFFNCIGEVSGKKRWLIPIPAKSLILIAGILLQWGKLTGNPPLITPEWCRKYLYDWNICLEKARNELGYEPVSLKSGIKKTVEWLNEQNELN